MLLACGRRAGGRQKLVQLHEASHLLRGLLVPRQLAETNFVAGSLTAFRANGARRSGALLVFLSSSLSSRGMVERWME